MTDTPNPLFLPDPPLELGDELVDFELADVYGRPHRLSGYTSEVLVIDFWSAECPISQNYDPYFEGFAKSYGHKGVTFLAIDSNQYEDEGDILRAVEARNLTFPILRDPDNRIADYFGAVTTPHLYVFDRDRRLRYRGAVDDTTFKNKEASVNYLEEAVDALLLGNQVTTPDTEPFGCTINRVWAG
jgi:thiol-disulfide isomerase/thioredoxin